MSLTPLPAVGPGAIVADAYRVIDVLAIGGSGTVYRAEAMSDAAKAPGNTRVALKLMHAAHAEGDKERRRFLREAELVRGLDHAHIIKLLDFGHTHEGLPFLVFPLLDGENLGARLKRHREKGTAIDPLDAGELAVQILDALDALHRRGIAHRDVKPANVFLATTPLGEAVQLLDFGLAKASHTKVDDVTRMGAVVGTPRYMAPEQARGERVGPPADVYAMGLVLGEMIAGEALIKADAEIDIYVAHGSDRELKLPESIRLSPYASIIRRAVSKAPTKRYRTATQMLADVEAATVAIATGADRSGRAELDVTQRRRGVADPMLSEPNETSEKLREVFNRLAENAADLEDEAPPSSQPPLDIPEDRPTIRMAIEDVPEARVSEPIALIRRISPAPPALPIEPTITPADATPTVDDEPSKNERARPKKGRG